MLDHSISPVHYSVPKNSAYRACVDSVNEGHCVRDAVEGQSSCTVIHIHSYSRGDGDLREKSVCYCARMKKCHCRSNTRTDHYVQSYTHFSVPFCWCSYMTLIFSPHHSTQPPSNCTHTLSTQHMIPVIKSVWMLRIFFLHLFIL